MRIRSARAADAAALADLTTQLGYPTAPAELEDRMAATLGTSDHALLVAAGDDDRPPGWIHVALEVGLGVSAATRVLSTAKRFMGSSPVRADLNVISPLRDPDRSPLFETRRP